MAFSYNSMVFAIIILCYNKPSLVPQNSDINNLYNLPENKKLKPRFLTVFIAAGHTCRGRPRREPLGASQEGLLPREQGPRTPSMRSARPPGHPPGASVLLPAPQQHLPAGRNAWCPLRLRSDHLAKKGQRSFEWCPPPDLSPVLPADCVQSGVCGASTGTPSPHSPRPTSAPATPPSPAGSPLSPCYLAACTEEGTT